MIFHAARYLEMVELYPFESLVEQKASVKPAAAVKPDRIAPETIPEGYFDSKIAENHLLMFLQNNRRIP